jgi:hypothetical protein
MNKILKMLISILVFNSPFCIAQNVENKIWSCVKNNYENYSIDIEQELIDYQQFLVNQSYLKDTTGASFILIYQNIVKENDNLILLNSYDQFRTIGINQENFSGCYIDNKERIMQSNHPFKKYYELLNSKLNGKSQQLGEVSKLLLEKMAESDFDSKVFRYYSLYTLLMTSNSKN